MPFASLRPVEPLAQRLIRGADAAAHGRAAMHLEIADLAVAVQVEIGERRPAHVAPRVDERPGSKRLISAPDVVERW